MSILQINKVIPDAGLLCPTEQDTHRAGLEIGSALSNPAIMSLTGPLGAGKTVFVRGLAEGLGCEPAQVSSPTFALIHEYPKGRWPLVHMDLYRLQSTSELTNLGLDDYLAEPIVAAIEWGERFEQELPQETIRLHFTIEGDGRRITIKP